MNCPWRGCELDHGSLEASIKYHDDRGEFESKTHCALDYHFRVEAADGERYSSRKPSLDYYDHHTDRHPSFTIMRDKRRAHIREV